MKRSLFNRFYELNKPANLLFSRNWLFKLALIIPVIFSFNFVLNAQVITTFSSDLNTNQQFKRPMIECEGNQLPGTWISQNVLFTYAVQKITVTVPGNYTFKTDSTYFDGSQDPMLFLYDNNFDPSTPLLHGIVANDDTLLDAAKRYKQSCISPVKLSAGTYTLVVTVWNDGVSGIANYRCSGPGLVGVSSTPVVSSVEDTTSNGGKPGVPYSYSLNQNYPNPFNPSTIISYRIAKSQLVVLKVYNVLGQLVTTLVNQQQNAGNHSVTFNSDKLASGIYIYSLAASSVDGKNGFNAVKKMLVLK